MKQTKKEEFKLSEEGHFILRGMTHVILKNTDVLIHEDLEILEDPEFIFRCKHCAEKIDQVQLRGISLICPMCGKPQNGMPHPKVKELM